MEDNDYTSHNIDYIICFDQLQRKDTRKKGNEDNWKVYQQLEEKEEQNIQNPFIREETKCILTEKEKQELRNQLLKIVTQCKDIYHPIIDQTTGYQSISREEVKKIKKRFGEKWFGMCG